MQEIQNLLVTPKGFLELRQTGGIHLGRYLETVSCLKNADLFGKPLRTFPDHALGVGFK
ncbi:hypothetical protein [Bradyrhizobium sp. CCBAU 25338]|uniref:hypothetical protein n=1 Tax=Bradyrhizobium sp. CCBAU 25338 TaxID=1641877 RepID=UPI002302A42A|nr:hypothetical protein [Bradyrhizobium sp. CCBAU 25338]